jgi:cytosine/adenosine deaminase-related metal-dependent hydrolase/ubiquinone/menaquinone biosynthesis C-methylase UbiE
MPSESNTAVACSVHSTANAFDAAAEFYDGQVNPMTALEERFLPGLLPNLRGLDVLDIGCGTGRWLSRLQDLPVKSLTGVDPSRRMLNVARRKLKASVGLLSGTADSLPVVDRSADVILMSFALSYSEDIVGVVRELVRVIRPHGSIFITDLHPDTELTLDWKRTFRSSNGAIALRTTRHSMQEMQRVFRAFEFQAVCQLEPSFGADEEVLFARAGKQLEFEVARPYPAIYIEQFVFSPPITDFAFTNGRASFGASAAAPISMEISVPQIATLTSKSSANQPPRTVDLSGCLVLPGLINSHDHLEFGLYSNLGVGPYQSCKEWADDIQSRHRSEIDRFNQIPKDIRLYWGGLRNLLSGVTTVCHHNPVSPVFRDTDFPVRVVEEIAWAHSLTFDSQIKPAFANSSYDQPFVIHASEGTDQAASEEVAELDRLGVLSDRTVLVHGLNCSRSDTSLINARGAALIACPSSNRFLYGRTIDPDLLSRVQNTALGTDSALTAAGDLLDEIKVAGDALQLDETSLYEMCTARPSSILRLRNGEGVLRVGGFADLLVIRDSGRSPAAQLMELNAEDIELVLVGGRIHLASETRMRQLPEELTSGLLPIRVDGLLRWVRAPLVEMFAEAKAVLGHGLFLGQKRVTYAG